tara:strand:- start:421 stop:840 length:420 start_codon:yes stop_codon:yes gene_type:complete
MKIFLILLLSFIITGCTCTLTHADSTSNSLSLSLPGANAGYQSDTFRDADGNSCTHALGSGSTLEFGVTGLLQGSTVSRQAIKDIGVYSRITIPIGAKLQKRSRLNCNRLYELTLQSKNLELLRLQQELNNLKALTFEN